MENLIDKKQFTWIKKGDTYIKGIKYKEPVINLDIIDTIPDYQLLKTYQIEAWYRYNNADDKDFIKETIEATSESKAEAQFKSKYNRPFFKIYIDLV